MLKKYPEVSSYMLNRYSRKAYTHADLDILEELLKDGFFECQLKGFSNGKVQFSNSDGVTLVGEFVNLNRRPNQWNGLYHFTAIRRSLAKVRLSNYHIYRFNGRFQFWGNSEFEYIIDINERRISWWPNNDSIPADLYRFKKSIEDVMSSIMFRESKDEFTYELVKDSDELLIGFGVVDNNNNQIENPYLNWGPETMTLEKEKAEVDGEPATVVYLKRDDVTVSTGVEEVEGEIRLHTSDQKGDAIETLWHRKGYQNIIWDEEVPEIIIEEEIDEA